MRGLCLTKCIYILETLSQKSNTVSLNDVTIHMALLEFSWASSTKSSIELIYLLCLVDIEEKCSVLHDKHVMLIKVNSLQKTPLN